MLPFLENKSWPRIGKPVGTEYHNYSEREELALSAMDDVRQALETKDKLRLVAAVEALIMLAMTQEDPDAPDTQQEASGV